MHTNRRNLGQWLIAAGLVAAPGCLTFGPQPLGLPPECLAACQQVPGCCRGKVFVFLIDGFDPLCDASAVRRTLVALGYNKVYDGHFYHGPWFADEIRRLHADEPDARFAVVGFSTEADAARALAEAVAKDGIAIDLLAYVDGPLWAATDADKPGNVGRYIRIPHCDGAAQLLAEELTPIAGTIPVITLAPTPPIDELPTPRPVAKRTASPRDAWDFLQPVARLDQTLSLPPASPPTAVGGLAGERSASR